MDIQEKSLITKTVNEVMAKKLEEVERGKQSVGWQRDLNSLFGKLDAVNDKIYEYGHLIDKLKKDIDETGTKAKTIEKVVTSPIVSNTIAFCEYLRYAGVDLNSENISLTVQKMIRGLSYETWKQKQVEGWGKNNKQWDNPFT